MAGDRQQRHHPQSPLRVAGKRTPSRSLFDLDGVAGDQGSNIAPVYFSHDTARIDTSAFLAVLNADDEFHQQAAAIWLDLLIKEARLITNSFVLVEAYALIQTRLGLAVKTPAREIIPLFEVMWIDDQLFRQTITSLLAANRQQLSLIDCSSFVTMHQNNITLAFTFDRHFSEQGFEVLGLKVQ